MPRTTLQRVLLTLIPAIVLASIATSAIWGESGLLVRHDLRERVARSNGELAAIERENQRLLRDLQLIDRDPVVLERMLAEELGWAREGSTIYRFDDTRP